MYPLRLILFQRKPSRPFLFQKTEERDIVTSG